MSADKQTLAVYEARAAEYAAQVPHDPNHGLLPRFIAALPPGGRVLDLGCGPGDAAARMVQAGLQVDPVDAAPAMVALARARHGLPARLATFDDLVAVAEYVGVCASFSLLHAPHADFPRHLAAIRRALQPGGTFYLGMKLGDGETRDRLGRFYAYYRREDLLAHLADAGFTLLEAVERLETGLSGDPAPGLLILAKADDV